MSTSKQQFEYDTILIAGWRKFWVFRQVLAECEKRGIDPFSGNIDRQVFNRRYYAKTEIRTAVYTACKELSSHLRACKTDADFVQVRNAVNRGSYVFSDEDIYMVSRDEKDKYVIDKRNMEADDMVRASFVEGSRKLGGAARTKRYGGYPKG